MHIHQLQNDTVSNSVNHRIPPPFLPEELIREILSRLSVKSLLQFKRVCKLWKTLISDSQFAKSHLQISRITTQQLVFSVIEEPYKIASFSLEPLFENSSTSVEPVTLRSMKNNQRCIIGSCNGLLCVFNSSQNTVKLWNPSIRFKSNKSPQAVSPDWHIMHYGFGYDQVNEKYKVLLVARNKYNFTQSLTKTYTFGENIWKTIPNFSFRPTKRIGKFVNGTLSWMVYKGGPNIFDQFMNIFSFDLEKETYREMLLPQIDGDNVHIHRTLYVLSDCLCVWDVNGVVWSMKEYGVVESWTKLLIIPYKKIILQNQLYYVEPLFISDNSVLLMRTKFSQFHLLNLFRNNANRTSFVEPLVISENGGVTLIPESSSELVLYNSNSGCLDPLITITSTLGLDLHIHCESLVSLQW
ncbi:F-box/kelch-repeat protein At3g23880-like [Vicia villosa]|uniref:F-box/kelch-repeat protein At3g23880-like n=1 Tax=Vicia villosa TaxID=3911 RepID=UPI00273C1EAF|nr:F-box/kelch-repeat protein At3g23880-like [Vicia villosa]XP_058746878.1 F-box/kelch-repeat protein At3g23880-like [Vicia villosa]